MTDIQKILDEALRQLKHNDGSDGFVFAYDKEIIDQYLGAGWRCCIDHLLKPEHPCPICSLEEADEVNKNLRAKIKQLESLLGRIHKATDQFYTKQKAGYCKKPDTTPYKDIIDLYHLILPDLPRVEKATEKRKAAMRQRWSNDLETLEDWTLYFKDAARKPFLFGRNDKGWVANFDFFLREQTIAFMQEGKYG